MGWQKPPWHRPLQHWVLLVSQWQHVNRSLRKAACKLRPHILHLASVVQSVRRLAAVLRLIDRCLAVGTRIHKSRKTPRTHDILNNPELSHCLT